MDGKLHCDLGVGRAVKLPGQETECRWRETTPQWPIMHAVLDGVTRDQMMSRHKANHTGRLWKARRERAETGRKRFHRVVGGVHRTDDFIQRERQRLGGAKHFVDVALGLPGPGAKSLWASSLNSAICVKFAPISSCMSRIMRNRLRLTACWESGWPDVCVRKNSHFNRRNCLPVR
jgi:hypothetical protein